MLEIRMTNFICFIAEKSFGFIDAVIFPLSPSAHHLRLFSSPATMKNAIGSQATQWEKIV